MLWEDFDHPPPYIDGDSKGLPTVALALEISSSEELDTSFAEALGVERGVEVSKSSSIVEGKMGLGFEDRFPVSAKDCESSGRPNSQVRSSLPLGSISQPDFKIGSI